MGMEYRVAQSEVRSILNKLPPAFLSTFMLWLDQKVVEFKAFGQVQHNEEHQEGGSQGRGYGRFTITLCPSPQDNSVEIDLCGTTFLIPDQLLVKLYLILRGLQYLTWYLISIDLFT